MQFGLNLKEHLVIFCGMQLHEVAAINSRNSILDIALVMGVTYLRQIYVHLRRNWKHKSLRLILNSYNYYNTNCKKYP